MVPLPRPSVLSYNQERPTSSGSVPSTRVAVDRSLISQLSRRVCPGSLGPHPPLGSARYVYVRGKRVCVWGEGGKEQACSIVLWSFIFTPSHPHPFPLLPRVQKVLISPGSHQPTRLGPSQNTLSTLASSPSSEHSQAPWHLLVSTVVWAALA